MHWILTKKDTKGQTESTLTLHPQFHWVDEFDWQAVVVSEPIYTITGAMIIETGVKAAGRPITLSGENAYITRADLKKLVAWASAPAVFSLACPDGRRFDVMFAKKALSNVKAVQPYRLIDVSDDDVYHATISLITV